MAMLPGSVRRLAASLTLIALLGTLGESVAQGASAPCRVRNVIQDTFGRSLVRMVERAVDGDRLRVRGTCAGTVVVDADLLIEGVGDAALTGLGRTRVVMVKRGVTATLTGLTILGGRTGAFSSGGGILNRGRLSVVESIIRNNRDGGITNERRLTLVDSVVRRNSGHSGAGILNFGRTVLEDSIVAGNHARGNGGGIYNGYERTLELNGSVVSHNEAHLFGGGIYSEGSAVLTESTVTGNTAGEAGGGVNNGNPGTSENGSLALLGSTITGNVAVGEGGGIRAWNESPVTLDADSTVSGNTPDDCVGTPAC